MTYSIAEGSWLFRNYDTRDDVTPFRFTFVRWVSLGDRHDIASVEILDPWLTHLGEQVTRAAFAARHMGFDLRALAPDDIPTHVHLLTTSPEFLDTGEIPEGKVQRAAWLTIEPVDWPADDYPEDRLAERPPLVFQTRIILSEGEA